jgi:hypothetical protein
MFGTGILWILCVVLGFFRQTECAKTLRFQSQPVSGRASGKGGQRSHFRLGAAAQHLARIGLVVGIVAMEIGEGQRDAEVQ